MRFPKLSAIAVFLLLLLLTVSCVKENREDCLQYTLHMKAADAEGNELTTGGVLEKADLYLFGEEGFIRMVQEKAFLEYYFGEERNRKLTLVAWGNVKEDTLITTEIAPGTSIEDARLLLKRHATGNHLPVTDLFYCRKELNAPATRSMTQAEDVVLVMERLSACVSIRTYDLAGRYPSGSGEPCRFIVHGTGAEMNFNARITGEEAGYEPPAHTDTQGDAYTPPFRTFPTGEGERIQVDVYRGENRLCTVTNDKYGRPLRTPAGKRTEIEIDFRPATVEVTIVVRPWEEQVEQNTEM